jgi:hypothetical protein
MAKPAAASVHAREKIWARLKHSFTQSGLS